MPVVVELGRCFRESILMFWSTFWALALGFTVSGFVQARVPRAAMRGSLGARRPGAISKALGMGMASSSCSYAAASIARSLFEGGADFVVAIVFMVASTNLVVELGVVLVVLLGWQFLAAQLAGGLVMIALLALLGGFVFTSKVLDGVRDRRQVQGRSQPDETVQAVDDTGSEDDSPAHPDAATVLGRSGHPWRDAADRAVADASMLRTELVIGFLAAGALAVLVPTQAWSWFFVHGHGPWTSLENAVVAPATAMLSCVCSIGNVPLAAALWSKGVSFGGVVAFVFADLVALPLVFTYRRLYGTRIAVRLTLVLYVLAVIAGLVTDGLFTLFGLVPHGRTLHLHGNLWDPTTLLNVVMGVVAAAEWWVARGRTRFGRGRHAASERTRGELGTVGAVPRSGSHRCH
jgi:uncharacterized protein